MKKSGLAVFGGLFFVVMYSNKLVTVNTSPTCSWNQITRLNDSKETCWDCPRCSEGSGLIPQCSSYVSMDVQIQCVGCKAGRSFSDVNDISSCKPCTICGDNEVTIRSCNTTHNAICGKCKPGFYRAITEDCWPCTKCCPDSTDDDLAPQCLEQGLPAKQSCRLDFKTSACANQPTPKNIKKDIGIIGNRNDSGDGSVQKSGNGTVNVRYHIITKHAKDIWIFLGVGIFLCLLFGVIVYAIKNCRRQSRKDSMIGLQEAGYVFSAEPTPV